MKFILPIIHFYVLIYLCLTITSCYSNLEFVKIDHETIDRKWLPEDSLNTISENFIVHGFRDTEKSERDIDDFVCGYVIENYKNYERYSIAIYKASRRTNMKRLKEYPDGIAESLMRDYLWKYSFHRKFGFVRKSIVKNRNNRKLNFEKPECWKGPSQR